MHWIIPAIRKHIEPGEALASTAVGVRVEEAADDGVIISALQVIEAGLFDAALANGAKNGVLGSRNRLLKYEEK